MHKLPVVPWSSNPSSREVAYRKSGLQRTAGTLFLLPPIDVDLAAAFDRPHKERGLSVGARALCKHHERKDSAAGKHPFWILPTGSEAKKSAIARNVMHRMLDEAEWKNVLLLHTDVATYEIRNAAGYGMRWTLDLMSQPLTDGTEQRPEGTQDTSESAIGIRGVTFRGFLEPPRSTQGETHAT